MEAIIQIVLIISVVALTAIFLLAGIWTIIILKDIRKLTSKAGEISDNLKETTGTIKDKVKEGINFASVLIAVANLWSKKKIARLLDTGQELEEEDASDGSEPVRDKILKPAVKSETKPAIKKSTKKYFFRKKR